MFRSNNNPFSEQHAPNAIISSMKPTRLAVEEPTVMASRFFRIGISKFIPSLGGKVRVSKPRDKWSGQLDSKAWQRQRRWGERES